MLEFNREKFRKFILDFDPIDYKYGKWDKKKENYVWSNEAQSQGGTDTSEEEDKKTEDKKAETEYYNLTY